MPSTIRPLLACTLLAFTSLTAVMIAYSGDDGPGLENPALVREDSANMPEDRTVAQEVPAIVLESPRVARERPPVVLEAPEVVQQGPILLPVNPPYLNRPVANQGAAPGPLIEPAPDEAWLDQEDAEEGNPDEQQVEDAKPDEEEVEDAKPNEEESEQPAREEQADEASKGAPEEEVEEATPDEEESEQPAREEQADEASKGAPEEEAPETTPSQAPALPKPEPKRELSPAMAALRERVRRTIAFHRRQALSTRENTATEVMHCCLAFGCNAELYRGGSPAKKVNGITCLCWNYPCAGYEPLGLSEGRIAARIGYGLQEHPSQLLAVLALSRVQSTYPIRVGEDVRSVADLVEYEKLSCRCGTDLSLKLIGLTYYLVDDPTWKNSLGEDWSIERIVKEEIAQPIVGGTCGGTHRLIGLSYVLDRRAKCKQPIEGQFRRARKLVDQYHEYALKVQNRDGSWSPQFLAAKGTSRNQATQLRSTGHLLEWLAMSLPEDRLEDPRVVRSVEYVNRLLSGQRYRSNVKSLSTREIGSVMHALHALVVYDERFFKPRTPKT